MIKMIMFGCNGAMGRVISECVKEGEEARIVAGVSPDKRALYDYPVYASLSEVKESADVIVDFSRADAVDGLLEGAVARRLPLVLATTGLSEMQLKKVEEAAREIPLLFSSNLSLGINLLHKLLADAAKVLSPEGFDIEIVERHHRRKVDAPSGTALSLAESLNEALGGDYRLVFSRRERNEKRPDKEIGISSVRAGNIAGEHDIYYAGEDEVVMISHKAYSNKVFAKGAIKAALFLVSRPEGLYSMRDVIG